MAESPRNRHIITPHRNIKELRVEEVTVYRNLYGRSEAETYKWDKGRGKAEFLYQRCTVTLRHEIRLQPVLKLT